MMNFNATFLADAKSLFLGQQEENMGAYFYSTPNPAIKNDAVNGEKYYREAILENTDYYLYKDEAQLINKVASKMANYVSQETHIIEF